MSEQARNVSRRRRRRRGSVRPATDRPSGVPTKWILLAPGDAALTRRVKAAGAVRAVAEKRGNRTISLGVWAPAERIASIRAELAAERSTAGYARRRTADAARRERKQTEYVEDFRGAVVTFLAFAPCHADLAERLASAIATRATPIGSGTVARTARFPIEQRAELAVMAWLRHQTTTYDAMHIPRTKGKRRKVRRMLAHESRRMLQKYRAGKPLAPGTCLLRQALEGQCVRTPGNFSPAIEAIPLAECDSSAAGKTV